MNKVEVDYVPRRCEATNRVIAANDHSSVLIPIAEVSFLASLLINYKFHK